LRTSLLGGAPSIWLDATLTGRCVDLIKWSFVFWVSAVGAIAVLAGILK
jgi:hypothetical protein